MKEHDEKVKKITAQIINQRKYKKPLVISKKSVSHFVPLPNDPRYKLPKIDIKSLDSILKIDAGTKTCEAESGVTFSALVKETLKFGLIPYTVPELKTITIGGAVSGCSIESMSYKFGGFHDSCMEYEILTGEGEILNCSREKNPEIFEMVHGSYGTIGIITKLKFKLIPAKPYVHIKYESFDNFEDYWDALKNHCLKKSHDFIDSIIHSNKKFVICLADMIEIAPYSSNYEWLNIFFKSTAQKKEDYMNIYDYFFRYDADCHWMTKTIPLMTTKIGRFLFGKLVLGSTNLIKWSKKLRHILKLKKRPEVVVDTFIPSRNFQKFFKWYEKEFNFYPLWIIPYKAPISYPWLSDEYSKKIGENFFIDAAIYGKKNSEEKDYSKILEEKVYELDGIKTLISRNHYNEKTFWEIYSKDRYLTAKKISDPENIFGNVYRKMCSR